jgi:hypothetical protein
VLHQSVAPLSGSFPPAPVALRGRPALTLLEAFVLDLAFVLGIVALIALVALVGRAVEKL